MPNPVFDYQSGVLPTPTTLRDRALLILRRCDQDLLPRLQQLPAKRRALAAEYRTVIATAKAEQQQRMARALQEQKQLHADLKKLLEDIPQNHPRRQSAELIAQEAMAAMAPMVPNASITATSSPVPRKHPLVDGVDAEEKVPKRVKKL